MKRMDTSKPFAFFLEFLLVLFGGEEADENHVGGPQHVHVRLGGGEGEAVDL